MVGKYCKLYLNTAEKDALFDSFWDISCDYTVGPFAVLGHLSMLPC